MVRKLLKYDLRAVFKYLLVIYAIVLGTAGLNRLLQFFESNQVWYQIGFRSSLVLLVIGIASMLLLTEILLVGAADGVVNREKLEAGRAYAPQHYVEAVIEGGNHAGFGCYGPQKGDGPAALTPEEQQAEAVRIIMETVRAAK